MQPELIEEDIDFDFDEIDNFVEFEEFDDDDDDSAEFGDYDEFDDDDDMMEDDDDDDSERRRRRRRRRRGRRKPRTGRGRGYLQRQLKGYAKRSELQSSLAKVGRDVRRNASGIKSNARGISSNRSRISSVSRVNGKQSKEIAAIRKEMADAKQFSLLMSLLDNGPATYDVIRSAEDDAGNLSRIVMDKEGDELTTLLPLLMSSGSGGGGFDNPLMLLLLLGQK